MKVIVAGSRTIHDPTHISDAIKESGFKITELCSGCAQGADRLGENWANARGVPVKKFPADWKNLKVEPCKVAKNEFGEYNKLAGLNRNRLMGEYAEALIVIHDGSKGSEHMLEVAKELGLKIYEKKV